MAEAQRPIVIKKIKKYHRGHGGQWKIAYADFITAMMAFFLLMWLLSAVTPVQLKGIAEYFSQPLKAALFGGDRSADDDVVYEVEKLEIGKHDCDKTQECLE